MGFKLFWHSTCAPGTRKESGVILQSPCICSHAAGGISITVLARLLILLSIYGVGIQVALVELRILQKRDRRFMKSGSNLSISPYSCVRLKLWHAHVMLEWKRGLTLDRSFPKNGDANSLEPVSTYPILSLRNVKWWMERPGQVSGRVPRSGGGW